MKGEKRKTVDDYFNRNKWIYSISGMGRDMSYALFTNFLLTYILFTRNVTDKQFAVISTILVACRIWDGLNDPIMGGVVENTRTRFGKFKPWIMIGCITNGAAVIAMFSNRAQGWTFIYLFVALYLIWDITYTMNDIGYWSMMPSRLRPRSRTSRRARRRIRTSASVSTKILMSSIWRSTGWWKISMPSTMTTLEGRTCSVRSVRWCAA